DELVEGPGSVFAGERFVGHDAGSCLERTTESGAPGGPPSEKVGLKWSRGTYGDLGTVAPFRAWRGYQDRMARGSSPANAQLAERVGFEPTLEFPLNTLSKRAPSATRSSLQCGGEGGIRTHVAV